MKGRPRAYVALLVAVVSCGGPVGVRDDLDDDPWYELRSAHFTLTTDLPLAEARERAVELEETWAALLRSYVLVLPRQPTPSVSIPVVHLRSCDDFRDVIWSDGIGGYVVSAMDFEGRRTVVTCEHPVVRREVLAHELSHVLSGHYLSYAPRWLSEGLATYYQTARIEDGQIVLGHLPQMDGRFWLQPKWLPSLKELLSLDAEAFYEPEDRRHYFAAWRLVHLLTNSSNRYRGRFQGYLARLGRGDSREDAWAKSFGDIPISKLSEEYREYQFRDRIRLYTTPFVPPSTQAEPTYRALRTGEIHALWAHLLMIKASADGGKDEREAARKQLALAAERDSSWSGTQFWLAAANHYLNRDSDDAETLRLLRGYLERKPGDARALLAVVQVRVSTVLSDDHLGVEPEPLGLAAIAPDVDALARVAKTTSELDEIAWYYALRHLPEKGRPYARRALSQEPGCVSCLDTLALLQFHAGEFADAVESQAKALNKVPEGAPPRMRQRLDHYRRALASERSVPDPPSEDQDMAE